MIYLDTTISSREDLDFIKYIRIFPQVLCDVELFKGNNYDPNYAKDHFFKNDFERMSEILLNDKEILSFSNFQNDGDKYVEDLKHCISFLNGINPNENSD